MSKGKGKNPYQYNSPPLSPARRFQARLPILGLVFLTCLFCFRVIHVHREDVAFYSEAANYGEWGTFEFLEGVQKSGLSKEERERLFLSIPNARHARMIAKRYSANAHLAGSKQDRDDALLILKHFQTELGIRPSEVAPIFPAGSKKSQSATRGLTSKWFPSRQSSAWIDEYYPVMDRGVEQRLQILQDDGSVKWNAELAEDGDPDDGTAHRNRDAVPTWHGASANGDVQGKLVYANYGTPADYEELLSKGANLTGKIILTRYYGGILRGLKVKGAEELGAAAVLMYNDPRDDGFLTPENGFKPYPAGPARNPTSIQRGTVAYANIYPGDPTTPGYPAYPDAERLEGTNSPFIPSLPISWNNAQHLLAELSLGGAELDLDEARKLNGRSSNATVRVVNRVEEKVMPIWNVMAAIPGHVRNEVVLVGGHRDAWVMGASDPVSGTASIHEIMRGVGVLLKAGWKPLRTIVFASWDAEEYGLIGSTEYGEDFADWLKEHVVAYLNVDDSAGGSRWGATATPSLAHLAIDTAKEIPHPTTPGKTLFDARNDDGPIPIPNATLCHATTENIRRGKGRTPLSLLPLPNSGSDYTVFWEHIGIPSFEEAFDRTPQDAVFHSHSIYDSLEWMERYGDPEFHRTTAVAKHVGLMLLRLTDSVILPLNTTHYSLELHDYLDELEEIVAATTAFTKDLDFSFLRESISYLTNASRALDAEKAQAEEEFNKLLDRMPSLQSASGFIQWGLNFTKRVLGLRPDTPETHYSIPGIPPIFEFIKAAKRVGRANRKLMQFERGFIMPFDFFALKGQEWFKHRIVAPGRWLGYGVTKLPAINQAIVLDKNVTQAQEEVAYLGMLLNKLASDLRE
ncbi:Zn-dependent exopeptidase [Favolaschia claudopus]|uniref:Zn-dependent exopeptidase n=1 Tax=Favolaschia claudopus TaxID=2862362 RepID=A0AAW0D282_9AGAR